MGDLPGSSRLKFGSIGATQYRISRSFLSGPPDVQSIDLPRKSPSPTEILETTTNPATTAYLLRIGLVLIYQALVQPETEKRY